ncbi:MAG: tetratricopeptide repeat protein [Candidatus Erginobacter occultus]|nr:tetratricopeptide repeat protein [Candidatus Erginobacter occultus]
MREKKSIIIIILLLLYAVISGFKVHYIQRLDRYLAGGEDCFYWTESAFHYRYAAMVAGGETIPPVDRMVQYPESVNTYEDFTVFMEPVAGFLYRVLAPFTGVSFFDFLIYFNSFFSSLSIFAVYLLAREIWKDRRAALLAAFFYALTPASYGRLIIGSYLRESFSLPWIFFSIFFFLKERSGKKSLIYPVLSGFCLSLALASWHFAQFYYTFFIFALFVAILLKRVKPRVMENLAVLTGFAVAAGVFVPALRTKGFLLSWPMLASYALLIFNCLVVWGGWEVVRRKKLFRAGLLLFLTFALILPVGLLFRRHGAEYSHVFSFLKYKLLFLGIKPADPGLLPYSARVMWTSNANTVPLNDLVYYLSSTLFIALAALAAAAGKFARNRIGLSEQLVFFLAGIFLVSYILVVRLEVFAVFFLSLFVARFAAVPSLAGGKRFAWSPARAGTFAVLAALLLLLIPIRQMTRLTLYEKVPPHAQRIDLVRWIRENTEPDQSFLTSFPLGSTISTYALRPIILHSKFESEALRKRVEEFTFSLCDTEEDFHRFCRRYRADYFIYQTDLVFNNDRESHRYAADRLKLRKDSAAYKFHFRPESLENFSLVHQDNYYRIFRVRGEREREVSIVPFYHPSFDVELYINRDVPEEYFDDRVAGEVNDSLLAATESYHRGLGYWNRGEYEKARIEFERAVESNDRFIMATFYLGGADYRDGDYTRGIERFRRVTILDPVHPEAFSYLGMGYEELGDLKIAGRAYQKAFELDPANPVYRDDLERAKLEEFLRARPDSPGSFRLGEEEIVVDPGDGGAYNRLGVLHWRSGRYRRAIAQFEKAVELDPRLAIAYYNLGINHEALGETARAREYFRQALEIDPESSQARNNRKSVLGE